MVDATVLGGLRRCEVPGLRIENVRLGKRRGLIADGKGVHSGSEGLPFEMNPYMKPAAYDSGDLPVAEGSR